ncbi:MAG TPA: NBR1-Ig-like domain-containing protein [Anaerolineales bacterium]|nr:NBR1-Ig-like domain-containing protein [Anaerolineales bacterium]
MNFARRSSITLLLIGILLTACGATAAGQPTPDVNATIASGAETLAAALFQTQTAMAPTATYTPLATLTPLATNTALALPSPAAALPTSTQQVIFFASATPTGTFYTSTPSSSSLAVGCSNASLIRDVTIPSGTQFKPGEKFTKTWQIANNGTCPWLYSYSLVHASGNRMGAGDYRLSHRINVPVPVGEWRQVSVELDAPQEAGTYTATWRLANGEGKLFGASFGVSIVVKKNPDPTKTNTAPAASATPNAAQTALAQQQTAVSVQQTANAVAQTQAAIDATASSVAATASSVAATQACVDAGGPPNPPCQP